MRTKPLLVFLFLLGCAGGNAVQTSDTPAIAPVPERAQAQGPVATGPWAELYTKHGDNLLNVTRSEMSSVSYNVSRKELVLVFDYPMQLEDNMIFPSKEIDYVAINKTLGATQVGEVPRDYLMKCGTNHGGDFEVAGAKFGIYVSGGCHHVRIFDATPEAVKLLVGAEFIQYIEPCLAIEFGEMCRTETTIRLKASAEPKRGGFVVGYRMVDATYTAEGWLEVEVPSESKTQDFDKFVYAAKRVNCGLELPELSPIETCGLSGNPYVASEQCLFGSGCGYDGSCTTRDGKCVAVDDASCKDAYVCEYEKRCVARDGVCVEP
jgi:hypothetical protein